LLIDVNEQNNFQIWEFGPEVESVYLEISHLGGITKHNDVFGYYLDSAGTFQSINNFGAGEKRTIQIERNNKDFIGFGILDKNTNDLWVTEKDKNWDKLQHAVIYNYSEGNYAFGFEDLKNQGDADYQDVVLNVEVLECVFSE